MHDTRLIAATAELVGTGVMLGAGELSREVETVAHWLRRMGAQVVAWELDNGVDWIVLDLACSEAGVVAVPLPGYFTHAQADHALRDCDADLVVLASSRPLPVLDDAAIVAGGLPDLLAPYRIYRRGVVRNTDPGDVAKITYTSGTTGRPKGVCLSQRALGAVAGSLLDATRTLDLQSHLCLLPLATLLENVAGVLAPLAHGMQVVAPPLAEVGLEGGARFDVLRFLLALHRYRPNSLILLPQMLLALVTAVEQGETVPEELRFVAVGGARVPVDLLERAQRCRLPVFEGYGLSECGSVVALNRPGAHRPGSVGRPLPHARVRIAADGEIFVAGATMSGYVGETGPEPAEIATGDLGHFDPDGYLYVHGRKKNVFITSFGRNVSPEWVEAELTASATIAQAVVSGEGRPFNIAVLVPRPGIDDGTERLRRAVELANTRLPDYARIGCWIVADRPFTLANGLATANGRPRREAILAEYANRIEPLYARSA
jgi:long-chain acyl-CoA synthetase